MNYKKKTVTIFYDDDENELLTWEDVRDAGALGWGGIPALKTALIERFSGVSVGVFVKFMLLLKNEKADITLEGDNHGTFASMIMYIIDKQGWEHKAIQGSG